MSFEIFLSLTTLKTELVLNIILIMRNNIFLVGLFFLLGISTYTTTHAANANSTAISGIKLTVSGDYVTISWDDLDKTKKSELDGYAVAWGDDKLDVRNDKIARQYLNNFPTSLELRKDVTFDRDDYYHIRVFGYKKEDRKYVNTYGSKIIKWKYDINNAVTSTIEEPNDPVIADNSSNNNSSSNTSSFSFGVLRSIPYDTMIRFSWSHPDLTDSEFDNFVIVLSEKSDLSEAILEADIDKKILKARIDGLKPNTTYYAAGYFEEDGKRFGKSDTITIKTIALLDSAGKAKLQRTLQRVQNSEGFGTIIDAGEYDDGTVATTTSSSSSSSSNSSSSSSSSSSTSTTRTTRTDFDIPDNAKDINAILRKLRAEIGALVRYEFKLRFKLRSIQSGQ